MGMEPNDDVLVEALKQLQILAKLYPFMARCPKCDEPTSMWADPERNKAGYMCNTCQYHSVRYVKI